MAAAQSARMHHRSAIDIRGRRRKLDRMERVTISDYLLIAEGERNLSLNLWQRNIFLRNRAIKPLPQAEEMVMTATRSVELTLAWPFKARFRIAIESTSR